MKQWFFNPAKIHIKLSKMALALCLILAAGQAWGVLS
jgi:hypothetical protein